jgi:hypothetical protein
MTDLRFEWRRGSASVVDDGTIKGHLFFHLGDDSSFRARPFAAAD